MDTVGTNLLIVGVVIAALLLLSCFCGNFAGGKGYRGGGSHYPRGHYGDGGECGYGAGGDGGGDCGGGYDGGGGGGGGGGD